MASEFETARRAIDLKYGDVVGSLIAAIQKRTGGIETEAAWVIATRPLLTHKGEFAI